MNWRLAHGRVGKPLDRKCELLKQSPGVLCSFNVQTSLTMIAGGTDIRSKKTQGLGTKTRAHDFVVGRHGFSGTQDTAVFPRARLRVGKHRAVITKRYNPRSLWIPLAGDTGFEKVLLGALVLAAGAAIAYGLWSMLDYVQNWPLINAWVAGIISS